LPVTTRCPRHALSLADFSLGHSARVPSCQDPGSSETNSSPVLTYDLGVWYCHARQSTTSLLDPHPPPSSVGWFVRLAGFFFVPGWLGSSGGPARRPRCRTRRPYLRDQRISAPAPEMLSPRPPPSGRGPGWGHRLCSGVCSSAVCPSPYRLSTSSLLVLLCPSNGRFAVFSARRTRCPVRAPLDPRSPSEIPPPT